MCRLLSTITLSYRRRIRLRKVLDVSSSLSSAPGPRVGAGAGRSFLRCCRGSLCGPARLPGRVGSHHDQTQQLPLSLRPEPGPVLWTSFLPRGWGSHQQAEPASGRAARAGPGGVTSPGSGSRSRGSQEEKTILLHPVQSRGRAGPWPHWSLSPAASQDGPHSWGSRGSPGRPGPGPLPSYRGQLRKMWRLVRPCSVELCMVLSVQSQALIHLLHSLSRIGQFLGSVPPVRRSQLVFQHFLRDYCLRGRKPLM